MGRKKEAERQRIAALREAALNEMRAAVAELRDLVAKGETGMGLRMAKMRIAKATKEAQAAGIDQDVIVEASKAPEPEPAPPEPEPAPEEEKKPEEEKADDDK